MSGVFYAFGFDKKWEAGKDISPEQTEFATANRIPFLNSAHPSWMYTTGVVITDYESPEGGIVPTDEEVTALAGFVAEYYADYYEKFREKMKDLAPYDIDEGANFGYFMKRPNGGWAYRKRTWEYGPAWLPVPEDPPLTIEELFESIRKS